MQLAQSYAGGPNDKTSLTIKTGLLEDFFIIIMRTMLVGTAVSAKNFLFFLLSYSRITKVIEVIKK